MSDESLLTPAQLVSAIAESIGFDTAIPNCDWGREFAEMLLATGDEEAIKYALADAGESYRSRHLSATRRAARAAVRTIANSTGLDGELLDASLVRQLSFKIDIPGQAPVPAGIADHAMLKEALRFHTQSLQGQIENNTFLRRATEATAPFPGVPLGRLIADGHVKPAALASAEKASAA